MKIRLIIITGIILLFNIGFYLVLNNNNNFRSPLIGKSIPDISLPILDKAGKRLFIKNIQDDTYIINFFASWCLSCKVEHEILKDVNKLIPIYGIAVRDSITNLRSFLGFHGDPYKAVALDQNGRIGIELGIKGIPESLVIKDGKIIKVILGPITDEIIKKEIAPLLNKINYNKI